MIEAARALLAIGRLSDGEIDIADAAFQLGRALRPDLDPAPVAAHLSALARDAAAIGEALRDRPADMRLGALAGLIHGIHAYRGATDTHDDLRDGNLVAAHDGRRGLPVLLGILWIHCIRAAGWDAEGIDFPGHFLVRMNTRPATPGRRAGRRDGRRDGQFIIDCFQRGAPVGMGDLVGLMRRHLGPETDLAPGMLRPMSDRDVLLRLQRNTAERQRLAGEGEQALSCLETMLAIAPDRAALWREAGILNASLERNGAALACFERFLALVPDGEHSRQVVARMAAVRAKLS